MKNRNSSKITVVTGFVVLMLTLSFPFSAAGESGTGILSGTVKVFRVRHSGDVVVSLEGEGLKKDYPPPAKHDVIDQKNLIFIPRVLPLLKGTVVDYLNNDTVKHNIYAPGKSEKFNLGTWGPGEKKTYTHSKLGEVVLLCNVHSEMMAYVIVLENPYFAKTDRKGNFKIENIPPGNYVVKTWHERMKSPPQEITIAKGETKEIHFDLKRQ